MKLYKKIFVPILFLCVMGGCVHESNTLIKKKLLAILQDDLNSIVNEINKDGIADSTYFSIVEYAEYKGEFTKKAVVDFYIFKKVNVKIVRKYRYHATPRKWERYFNEYKFIGSVKKQ